MTINSNYQILPDEPKPVEKVKLARGVAGGLGGGGGCLVWGILYAAIVILINYAYEGYLFYVLGEQPPSGPRDFIGLVSMLCAGAVTIAINSALKKAKIPELEKQKVLDEDKMFRAAIIAEQNRVNREAETITNDLRRIYESSINLVAGLAFDLEQASFWLEQAEEEYKENAAYPYWDALQQAANKLAAYNDKTNSLSQNAQQYYEKLLNRKHTFPLFPTTTQLFPRASSVLDEFYRICRLGHKNTHFTNVLGHRKTQETLIAGFRSLDRALRDIPDAVQNSMSGLEKSISSDVAILVNEQIKTREVTAIIGETLNNRLLENKPDG